MKKFYDEYKEFNYEGNKIRAVKICGRYYFLLSDIYKCIYGNKSHSIKDKCISRYISYHKIFVFEINRSHLCIFLDYPSVKKFLNKTRSKSKRVAVNKILMWLEREVMSAESEPEGIITQFIKRLCKFFTRRKEY